MCSSDLVSTLDRNLLRLGADLCRLFDLNFENAVIEFCIDRMLVRFEIKRNVAGEGAKTALTHIVILALLFLFFFLFTTDN